MTMLKILIETADGIRNELAVLLGSRLIESKSYLATRTFCFALCDESSTEPITIGVECPWRMRRLAVIVTGSEDYSEDSDAGESSYDRQTERLVGLLGEWRDESVFNCGSGFVVEGVDADDVGGFKILMTGGHLLEVFPTTSAEMEWIISSSGNRSLVLMNGVLNLSMSSS